MQMMRLICACALIFFSSTLFGKTFRVGNYEYETEKKGLYQNEVKLKKDLSSDVNVSIPETVNFEGVKYTVGIIDNEAFKDNKHVATILIPGSVHALGMNAFKNLKTLHKISALPATSELRAIVEKPLEQKQDLFPADFAVGFCAFANCENLDSIDFSKRKTIVLVPKNLYGTKAWGFSYPFENCKSLKSVVFGDVAFSDDGMNIFKGCHALESFITSTVNPSRFKKMVEPDCPFMTKVYPLISSMSETDYLAYLNKRDKGNNGSSEVSKHTTVNGINEDATVRKDIARDISIVVPQEFVITNDIMSVPLQRKDNNGNICALLKVVSTQNNLSFEGNIVGDVDYKNGNQYWVYVSPGSQKIKINAPGNTPKLITFNDYGVHHLDPKRIYEYSYIGVQTQKLRIVCTPVNSTVLIDGSLYDGENGIVEAELTLGEHSYIVASKGYVTSEGVVKLRSDGQTNININLTETNKQ